MKNDKIKCSCCGKEVEIKHLTEEDKKKRFTCSKECLFKLIDEK